MERREDLIASADERSSPVRTYAESYGKMANDPHLAPVMAVGTDVMGLNTAEHRLSVPLA